MELRSDMTTNVKNGSSKNRTDFSRVPYEGCRTRIIDLKCLPQIPTAKHTPDSKYREIFHEYLAKSRQISCGEGETEPKSVKADGQEVKEESRAKNAHYLLCAITSLTCGIAPPVAFPTETVYGLGADATNPDSIAGIFAAKGRPSDNPLIVHISSVGHLERCLGGSENESAIPQVYRDLIKEFWPGPLTILIPVPEEGRGVKFAPNVHPGQKTIGFRLPESQYARFVIAVADRPIAAPSANSSGKPSPTMAQHVKEDLDGKINFILDGGSCDVGVESTVVDGLGEIPVILRPGGLSKVDLRKWGKKMNNVWQHVENGWEDQKDRKRKREEHPDISGAARKALKLEYDSRRVDMFESPAVQSPTGSHADLNLDHDTSAAPRAPGMKYKHYAPSGRMILFEAEGDEPDSSVNALLDELRELLEAHGPVPARTRKTAERHGKSKRKADSAGEMTGIETPVRDLSIAILSSTSWPTFGGFDKTWKASFPEWASVDMQKTMGGGPDVLEIDAGYEEGRSSRRHIRIYAFQLGKTPAMVARNLFAALRD